MIRWVKQGGTLIAHNRSSRFIASQESLGSVKQGAMMF